MRKSLLIISFFLTLSLAFLPMRVFAVSDLPYNHAPGTNVGGRCESNSWSSVQNPSRLASDSSNGVYSSDFTGKTITGIGLFLCVRAGFFNGGATDYNTACALVIDTGVATIGVFDIDTGNLVHAFGTVPWASIPCIDGAHHPNPQEFTVTGSFTMLSTQFIGVTFSSSNGQNIVSGDSDFLITIQDNDGSTSMANGGTQDELPGCLGTSCQSPGFALAGDISGVSASSPSHTALYTTWAPIVAIMVIGMAIFGLTRSKGTPLIVIVISLAVILGFVSVIMGVWS